GRPRPELIAQEGLSIGTQRDLIVEARSHIAEMRRRHVLLHHRLEIEDGERLFRLADELADVPRRPRQWIGRTRRSGDVLRKSRPANLRQQWAPDQELQDAATARGPLKWRHHHSPN